MTQSSQNSEKNNSSLKILKLDKLWRESTKEWNFQSNKNLPTWWGLTPRLKKQLKHMFPKCDKLNLKKRKNHGIQQIAYSLQVKARRSLLWKKEHSQCDSSAVGLSLGNYVKDISENTWFFLKQLLSTGREERKCNHGKHNIYIIYHDAEILI